MSQGSLNLKIRILGLKVCFLAHIQTNTKTDMKAKAEDIIKHLSNINHWDFKFLLDTLRHNNLMHMCISYLTSDKLLKNHMHFGGPALYVSLQVIIVVNNYLHGFP